MADDRFPALDPDAIAQTRDALHAYARVAGAWSKAHRRKRKHWWHASLRPSLVGLTTGVIYADTEFDIELDLAGSCLNVRTCSSSLSIRLDGQPSADVAAIIRRTLEAAGVRDAPEVDSATDHSYPGYSADAAARMRRALGSVTAALEDFRAGIREEKSPIQVWPHHFDLSMIWLPGAKVAGEDASDEESADKQMNFGFVFGDDTIAEPYFYVTAYPLPENLPGTELPKSAAWRSDGFQGAVLLYRDLAEHPDPPACLLDLWNRLLAAGRKELCADS